ncbi:hypothetical protein K2X30_13490 [bacterium]|jgi:hypothetical protein|nr:hypothetical protein [bacterium]
MKPSKLAVFLFSAALAIAPVTSPLAEEITEALDAPVPDMTEVPTEEVPTAPLESHTTATPEVAPSATASPAPTTAEAPTSTPSPVPSASPVPEVEKAETAPAPIPSPSPSAEPVMPTETVEAPATVRPREELAEAAKSEHRLDPRVPLYQQLNPEWAFTLGGAIDAFGASSSIPNFTTDNPVRAISLQWDYIPVSTQKYGLVAVGPYLNLYTGIPQVSALTNILGMFGAGAQVHYQARYFREQPLVPYVKFSAEYFRYNFSGGASGGFLAMGPSFGAMLLLNFLDERGAAEFYASQGALRSYLLAEFRMLNGSDANVTLRSQSLFFGLRFEF